MDYDPAAPLVKGPHRIRFHPNGKTFTYPESSFRVSLRSDAKAEVLAEIVDKDNRPVGPAIVMNRYGKGKCIYLACRLGMVNCETENTAYQKWTFEKNQELADVLLRVVALAINGDFDVKPVAAPERVLMSVHRQKEKDTENILVYFLNATGAAGLKKGDIVPHKKPEDPFPALTQDIVFDIRARGIASGIIVSPDYGGERPVTVKKMKDGYVRVSVNKEDMKAYAIVYLKIR